MTGFLESVRDTILIAKTDKRVWSAAGFLTLVFFIWFFTDSWRKPEPPKEETARYVKPEVEVVKEVFGDIQKDLNDSRRNREELNEVIKRASSELEANKQNTNWHMNTLVDKLDGISNRVDKLAKDVGSWSLRQAEIDRNIAAHQKKHSRLPKKVDSAEIQ
ncbi:MAG: hypothetical protein U0136_14335 [Bdellovibrionota bacterium]